MFVQSRGSKHRRFRNQRPDWAACAVGVGRLLHRVVVGVVRARLSAAVGVDALRDLSASPTRGKPTSLSG